MDVKRVVIAISTAIAYGISGVMLYRQRVVSDASVWNSDLVVFALPTAIAFLAFALTFWPNRSEGATRSSWSRVRALALAALSTGAMCWAYMVVALNRYGT